MAPKEKPTSYADIEETNPDDLTVQAMEVLRREIDYLLQMSKEGKLNVTESRNLTNYLRFLKEMVHQEDEALAKMSDEELAKFLRRKQRVAKQKSAARAVVAPAPETDSEDQ